MTILVLNAGSSSLKWKLFEMQHHTLLASGLMEGITEKMGAIHLHYKTQTYTQKVRIKDHEDAFRLLFESFKKEQIVDLEKGLSAIGHRVVHGGEHFTKPTKIDAQILEQLSGLNKLAPLHNPANILGIQTVLKMAPYIPNIAVFDTAFHATLPEYAYRYALPHELYEQHQIRRYGFHGTSHHYVALKAAEILQKPLHNLNLITLHLGNGASACAIKNGVSVDTSMGFTPLEGLVMGTRSGDIDPAIITYLIDQLQMSTQEVDTLLNKQSGLKGICDVNDLRTILQRADKGDKRATLALEIFTQRIKKYIGAYIAVLGHVDAIVFTGGIGEHAPTVRAMVLEGLEESFGLLLDQHHNVNNNITLHQEKSRIALLVIETNEELQIAIESSKLI